VYGQTEATARLSYLPPDRAEDKAGSIGIAIPGVELRVVDEHGRELPPGEVGELVARGQNVTPGYLDEPAETAAILRDGWLWTGDLAYRDADGLLRVEGRVLLGHGLVARQRVNADSASRPGPCSQHDAPFQARLSSDRPGSSWKFGLATIRYSRSTIHQLMAGPGSRDGNSSGR